MRAPKGGLVLLRRLAGLYSGVDTHPGLIVDDLETLCTVLQDAGYQTVPDQPLEGFARHYVSDPFGNRIELLEVLSASPSPERR